MARMKMVLLLLFFHFLLFSCSLTKPLVKSNKTDQAVLQKEGNKEVKPAIDTTKKGIKSYNDVITGNAVTKNGLFKVHLVNSRYYLEIPDSILNRDILIVNRISKAAAGARPQRGFLGYAGDYIGENVVQFEKGVNNRIFIKRISYLDVSHDSSENGMYRSVYNSNLQPIVGSFDIKAFSPGMSGSVIDLTDYLNGDNDVFFFDPEIKKLYGLGALQADKSYPQSISSFPLNTEIKTVKTYLQNEKLLTYELNSSLVLLPNDQMKPRHYDERVGYFARGYRDFDFPQEVKSAIMINRWRLEPKDEDMARYQQGQLVEPKKPIVFYIDPATPRKWVPYLIEGVNAWQKAFEKAGFKNAIYALEAPANDSSWSLEDARHNCIVYKASSFQNASGPQISDPRTGEILESHINWYHNVQKILHDWYFVQASPNDPGARTMEFDDKLMGQLIKYVCTHEVGHTLGLQHNFMASGTVSTDSLRSRCYVAKWGHTPSIMDYARFNYVAQPEDSIDVKDLIPKIGIYDEWAIEWGYRWLPQLKTRQEEKSYMNKWILESVAKDKRLTFANSFSPDCRSGAEDLGDDPVKASYYGIKNLKRVMANLVEWTKTENESYDNMVELKKLVWFVQYWQYLTNVARTIGGIYWTPKTYGETGPVIEFVSKEKQRAAVKFLQDELFDTPQWIDNKKIFLLIGGSGFSNISEIQRWFLGRLMDDYQYSYMLFNNVYQGKEQAYSFDELLSDLETGIWKELKDNKPIDFQRRILQKSYATKLINFIRDYKGAWVGNMDGCVIVEDHIKRLNKTIDNVLPTYSDKNSKTHLQEIRIRFNVALNYQKKNFPEVAAKPPASANSSAFELIGDRSHDSFAIPVTGETGCWNYRREWDLPRE